MEVTSDQSQKCAQFMHKWKKKQDDLFGPYWQCSKCGKKDKVQAPSSREVIQEKATALLGRILPEAEGLGLFLVVTNKEQEFASRTNLRAPDRIPLLQYVTRYVQTSMNGEMKGIAADIDPLLVAAADYEGCLSNWDVKVSAIGDPDLFMIRTGLIGQISMHRREMEALYRAIGDALDANGATPLNVD